jgi:hypothetical protein
MAHVIALRDAGRSNQIVATAPSRTSRTSPSLIDHPFFVAHHREIGGRRNGRKRRRLGQ